MDGNYPFNWDYSPQTTIGPNNVQGLSVSWIFPIPVAPTLYGRGGDEGVIITPIVVNGVAYMVTNYHLVLALDASSGKIVWSKELPILNFRFVDPSSNLTGHYHAIWYTSHVRGTPLLWVVANNYTVFAFNANTGDVNLQFSTQNLRAKIPGNFGNYGTITPQIVIDEKRGIMISGNAVSEGTSAGRGFFEGFDITQTPPKLLWTDFVIPPQDGSDPSWAINQMSSMSHAYIFNGTGAVDLKALTPTQLHNILYGDWGTFGFNGTRSFDGGGPGWGGSWAVDPSTGIAYVATAQPAADFNATNRPGPDLWADSVLAINDQTGQISWGFQSTAHDLWDWDCSWSVLLANVTTSSGPTKMVIKGCKDGYLFGLNAATGALAWAFSPPSIRRTADATLLNPLSRTDMTKPDMCYPQTSCTFNPWGGGGIESDPGYDPTTNTVFVAAYNNPGTTKIFDCGPKQPYGTICSNGYGGNVGKANTTVWAVDAATGKARWNWLLPTSIGFRGGVSVSNGVVYVPTADGYIYMLNAQSGSLITKKFIGGTMITQPAIATDSNGIEQIIMPGGTGPEAVGGINLGIAGIGAGDAGFIFALSLSGLSSATSVSGIDPTTFYAVVALLVVFIIATGFLAARRGRRPAP